jgi:hypothetical protein
MWSEDDDPPRAGRLDLTETTIQLEGGSRGATHARRLELADVATAYVGRVPADRIGASTTLVIELRDGGRLRVAAVGRPGALRELTERIQHAAA